MTATLDHDEHRTAQGRAGKPVGAVNPAHSRAHQHDTRQVPGGLFDYLNCNTRPGGIAILPGHLSFNCSRRPNLPVAEHRARPSTFSRWGRAGRTFNLSAPYSRAAAFPQHLERQFSDAAASHVVRLSRRAGFDDQQRREARLECSSQNRGMRLPR